MAPKRNDKRGNYEAGIHSWARRIESGAIPAGRWMRLAVRRYFADLKHAGSRGYYFDPAIANEAIWFIETVCVHTKNSIAAEAGDPLILTEAQRFIVWNLIGWRRERNGLRRFEKAFIEVARKFGKSTFAAALALYLLVFDDPLEQSAEIYAAATMKDQARIVFNEAKAMASRSRSLRKRLQRFKASLTFPRTNSFFQPIGSDSDRTDGLNTSAVIMDEIHAWQPRHRGLYEKLTTAGGARLQPLWIMITTAGDDRSRIWEEEHNYAERVAESAITGEIVDDSFFSFVCAIDYPHAHPCMSCNGTGKRGRGRCRACGASGMVEPDDPFDERVWIKANPNIGATVSIDKIRTMANEARHKPTAVNAFLRYVCNVRVRSSVKAIPPEIWEPCGEPLTVEPGSSAFGAFDLGRSDDFASIGLAFPLEIEDERERFRYELLSRSYTTEAAVSEEGAEHLRRWADAGLLIVHDGDQVDFSRITEDLIELSERYAVRSWAYDPTFAHQIGQTLLNEHGLPVFRFSQSFRFYNEPVRSFLRLLKRGLISHGGDPVLAWQAGNLSIKRNHRDEWMPDKVESANKIDAMVALFMALSESLFHEEPQSSVYEERGLRTL